MLKLLLLLPLAFALEWSDFTDSEKDELFQSWAKTYNKTYEREDYLIRKSIFLSNAERIYEINQEQNDYELEVNAFADMTGNEFREYIHGGPQGFCLHPSWKKNKKNSSKGRLAALKERLGFVHRNKKPAVNVPDSVDWTTKGVVTPVKNQGQCGSCWAFSTTGSIESETAIKTGKLVSLSEQELVDCSGAYGNKGCQGGLMDNAFKYVKAKGGLCSEQEYPYTGQNGNCKRSCGTRYDSISGYTDVKTDSSSALEAAVAMGPVSIAIEADQFSFQFYKRGVLSSRCGTRLDHGVLAVGYGTENGSQFWKVKNSWGPSWGESGYIKLCRNCSKNKGAGECGLLMQPSYPAAQ